MRRAGDRSEELLAIGWRISRARREAGFTQKDLAALVGVKERSVQAWEGGETHPYRHLRPLERILGKQREWFLHGNGEEQAPPVSQLETLAARVSQLEARLQRVEGTLETLSPDSGTLPSPS